MWSKNWNWVRAALPADPTLWWKVWLLTAVQAGLGNMWEARSRLLWSGKFINNNEVTAIFNKSWLADLFQKIHIAVNNTIYI